MYVCVCALEIQLDIKIQITLNQIAVCTANIIIMWVKQQQQVVMDAQTDGKCVSLKPIYVGLLCSNLYP